MTFKEAFAAARKKYGAKGTFTWNGKKYHTKYKEEVAAEKDKRKSSPKPKLRPEPKTKVTPTNKSGESPKKTEKKTKVTPTNKSGESPKTKKKGTPSKRLDTKGKTPPKSTSKSDSGTKSGRVKHKIQTTTKQPTVDTTSSSSSKPSTPRTDPKSFTSATKRVPPSRPRDTAGEGFKPYISKRATEATKAHEEAKKERNKVSPGMDFDAWYKSNGSKYETIGEAMRAWRESKKTKMAKGGMVKKYNPIGASRPPQQKKYK